MIQAAGSESAGAQHGQQRRHSLEPVEAHTRATAIRIGNPASWRKAARAIQETGGWCLDVTEAEIAIAKAEMGAEGLGCEPASAVTLAGLKKLRAEGKIGSGETVVLVLTGHTLKDADYTIDFHRGTLLTDGGEGGPGGGDRQPAAQCAGGGGHAGGGAGRAEGQRGMSEGSGSRIQSGLRLRLPATSANLGSGLRRRGGGSGLLSGDRGRASRGVLDCRDGPRCGAHCDGLRTISFWRFTRDC